MSPAVLTTRLPPTGVILVSNFSVTVISKTPTTSFGWWTVRKFGIF